MAGRRIARTGGALALLMLLGGCGEPAAPGSASAEDATSGAADTAAAGTGGGVHPPSMDPGAIFDAECASCHVDSPEEGIPDLQAMARLSPNAIVRSLTDGNMRLQGQRLSPDQRVRLAEYLTGREVAARSVPFTEGICEGAPPMGALDEAPLWNGWGPDARNARFQPEPGLSAADLPRLRLQWAFGLPDASQARGQPAVAGGRLFIANQAGEVYALDARTGCTYWTYEPAAGVRTAISVGRVEIDGQARHAVYFADLQANAYAVDAETGVELWRRRLDDHPSAQVTGAPTLHDGRLYVPMSGVSEEMTAANPDYECCTFRGSLTSLDAATGEVVWKAYTVPEPEPRGTSLSGVPLWGPAGVAIWSAPTVDPNRGLVYASTGNPYAEPDPGTGDAILAFDLETGELRWVTQATPDDFWIFGCDPETAEMVPGSPDPERNPNCPDEVGEDYDFGASPLLVEGPGGREWLVAPQKSGVGYALEPETGEVAWKYRWGVGSGIGAVWGAASDGRNAYFAVADRGTEAPGGVHAVDLVSGERVWFTPPEPLLCEAGPDCSAVQSAAVTAMPGAVFVGSNDGGMRAYDANTGEVVWRHDTNRDYATVNGVAANGGAIDGPGPVVAGGMVYVTSGWGGAMGRAGNVLLAFAVEDD